MPADSINRELASLESKLRTLPLYDGLQVSHYEANSLFQNVNP